jgi:hypothetical protein
MSIRRLKRQLQSLQWQKRYGFMLKDGKVVLWAIKRR